MFLANASIRRPIAMSCLIIGLALLGLNAYRGMALEMMPSMDVPFITVVTIYPGATPPEIETDVAKPIEDAVVSIDGLRHVTSSCMENVCLSFLEFQLGVDVDIVATDVREKIDLIRSDFPEDVEDPRIQKFDLNAVPVVTLGLTGDAPLDDLYDYADNTLRDRLSVIPGVADVQLIGGAQREAHVELDRGRLAARGLTSMDVVRTIRQGVRTIPSGRVREAGDEFSVKFDADYSDLANLANLEVVNDDNQRCHIRDVGAVKMTTAELRQVALLDGRAAISIRVVKKAEANAVHVTNQVRSAVERLKEDLPGGMDLQWVTDDGRFIEALSESAWINVFQGIFLTAAILFFFLYDLRAILVIGLSMPLTIVIGLFFMRMAGFSLNTSTLLAVGMSVGVLVMNSIVVLEAIAKRLKETGDPKLAAAVGSSEAFVAVLASASTNVVVLFPLSAMASKVGLFIRPLALTMLIMTAVSLLISFTLTPILCSLLLKPRREDSRSPLRLMERGWNWAFNGLTTAYQDILRFTERHRWAGALVLLAICAMFWHAIVLAKDLGTGFIADSDKGEITAKLEFPTRYGLEKTVERVREAERRLTGLSGLRHTLSTIGKVEGVLGKNSEGVYLAQVLLKFSERDEREETIEDIQNEVRSRLEGFPDANITVLIPVVVGGQVSDIEMEISGASLDRLDDLALRAAALTGAIPGVLDVDTSVRPGKPEIRIRPRRAALSDLGVPATGLGMVLRANLEGVQAGTFKREARSYDIVVKLAEEVGKQQIDAFLFPGTPGHPLVLGSLARIEESEAPVLITRKDKQRVAMLYANLGPHLPMGTAAQEIRGGIEASNMLPPGYEVEFTGMYEAMAEGQEGLAEAGLISIVLVFLTLAALLESFRQPVLILVTLPLAMIGIIWALALTRTSPGIFEMMGVVLLVGIVVNNAILLMDRFNVLVVRGVPRHSAMITAAGERFRPIVMVTLAAALGMVPLALGRGIGAELRNGVGIASIGGIVVSGILTLVAIPVLYDFFTRQKNGNAQTQKRPE